MCTVINIILGESGRGIDGVRQLFKCDLFSIASIVNPNEANEYLDLYCKEAA
jgi:hypothetical protein